jgi:hypothetical protein
MEMMSVLGIAPVEDERSSSTCESGDKTGLAHALFSKKDELILLHLRSVGSQNSVDSSRKGCFESREIW